MRALVERIRRKPRRLFDGLDDVPERVMSAHPGGGFEIGDFSDETPGDCGSGPTPVKESAPSQG